MRILITGFEPFGGERVTPAYEAVKLLPDFVDDVEIHKMQIPTEFVKSGELLEQAITELTPDAVICVGQAGGRSTITVEKVAINYQDADIPDNAGFQPDGIPIYKDGETAYFSNLPIKAMVQGMKDALIPAAVSYTAGTYVCNNLLYKLLYMMDKKNLKMKGGFVHVPYSREQVVNKAQGTPAMELITIARALEVLIRTVIRDCADTITK